MFFFRVVCHYIGEIGMDVTLQGNWQFLQLLFVMHFFFLLIVLDLQSLHLPRFQMVKNRGFQVAIAVVMTVDS
jgi:hypothetical protein